MRLNQPTAKLARPAAAEAAAGVVGRANKEITSKSSRVAPPVVK